MKRGWKRWINGLQGPSASVFGKSISTGEQMERHAKQALSDRVLKQR